MNIQMNELHGIGIHDITSLLVKVPQGMDLGLFGYHR